MQLQFIEVIPFKNYTEKKWLLKKYNKFANITVIALENCIMIENCIRRENNVKKKVRK